jgi:hypothetical protein
LPISEVYFQEKKLNKKSSGQATFPNWLHFIKTLHNTAKKVEDTKQKQWEITINCFEMADGTELTKDKLRAEQIKMLPKQPSLKKQSIFSDLHSTPYNKF